LENIIYRRLGVRRREVIVGPRLGVDNAVVRVGPRNVMVSTADPLSFIPTLGARASAWLSVNLIASDLTTSGFAPQYGIFDFNLPPTMSNREFARYWTCFHGECRRLGLAIIGGHTGRYQGCDYTVIGGGMMYSIGAKNRYLTSSMGKKGDDIILTKGAAIETTAVLTRAFPKTVRKALGEELFERAHAYLRRVSTVDDALAAASVGVHENGVTAMHDATEGGVIAAAFELANASGCGAELDLSAIPISHETEEICKIFGINPLNSLSEGSLLITCKPAWKGRILTRLKRSNIHANVIGQLIRSSSVYGISDEGKARLNYPKFDPYWKAYWKATRKHWR
jgi:hydrogenase maturation factor